MDKLLKGTIIAFAAIALLATTALATAMPISRSFEKAGYGVTWNEQTKTVTIEKPALVPQNTAKASHHTDACVENIGDGYIIARTESLGTICIMVDKSTHCANGTLSDIKKGSNLEVHFNCVTATSATPYIYASKIVIR